MDNKARITIPSPENPTERLALTNAVELLRQGGFSVRTENTAGEPDHDYPEYVDPLSDHYTEQQGLALAKAIEELSEVGLEIIGTRPRDRE